MSQQFNVTTNLSTIECPACGVILAIPCSLMKDRQKNHDAVYCPNGHRFSWPGKTDEEQRLENQEESIREQDELIQELEEQARKDKNRISYLKRKAKK